jgi:hypothetical protein
MTTFSHNAYLYLIYTDDIPPLPSVSVSSQKTSVHSEVCYPAGMVCGMKCKKYKTVLARGNSEKILVNHSCGGWGGGGGRYLSSVRDSHEGFWHKQIGGGQNQPKTKGTSSCKI